MSTTYPVGVDVKIYSQSCSLVIKDVHLEIHR